MTEAKPPALQPPPAHRGIRGLLAADPAITAIVLYAVVAMAAAVAAYYAIFTVFLPYDDEGTMLVTVQGFAHGEVLYRDIYSAYGPFYYELFGGLFALTGQAVTTDASRTIVIVVWVATSLLLGLTAQRLSGSLGLGLAGMIAAFAVLGVLVNEPMHPQGLCVLLLSAFALVAAWGPSRRGGLGVLAGAILAALVLTKINLGLFALAATVLAAVWTLGAASRRRWLLAPVVVAFLAMPLVIVADDLSLAWVRELLLLELLASLALLLAARPLRPRPEEDDRALVRWLLAALAGFVIAFVAILGAILLTGPSPADVYHGIVTQAMRVRDVLILQFSFPPPALDWAVAAVAAAALSGPLGSRPGAGPRLWPALLRVGAGVAILLAVARVTPFGLDPSAGNPDVLPMTLAWVAAVPPAGPREPSYRRFLRLLLPALAIAETLQVYPVAGSQTGIAAIAFVPVAALCLGDALVGLRAWGAARGGLASERLGAAIATTTIALAGMLALHSILLPGASNAITYRNQEVLALPGAGQMRLPADAVESYEGIVDLLHAHRCSTFVVYPTNVPSLYLWSGLRSPALQVPNGWLRGFDDGQQRRVIEAMRTSPRPCAVIAGEAPEAPPSAADSLLAHYLLADFELAAEVGGFKLLTPRSMATR